MFGILGFQMSSEEQWKVIEEFPRYEVSDLGRVRHTLRPHKILVLTTDARGYKKITLYVNRVQKNRKVHRLVLITFVPNPLNLSDVDHINGDKGDNRLVNLRWASRSQNLRNVRKVNSSTGILGVYKRKSKYVAKIGTRHLGTFTNLKDAELAHLKAEHEIAGEFMADVRKKRLDFLLSQTT